MYVAGIIGSTTGASHYVRILSTLDRERLKPNASVALHKVYCPYSTLLSSRQIMHPKYHRYYRRFLYHCYYDISSILTAAPSITILTAAVTYHYFNLYLLQHSSAVVDILPPEADSSISLLTSDKKPDISVCPSQDALKQLSSISSHYSLVL